MTAAYYDLERPTRSAAPALAAAKRVPIIEWIAAGLCIIQMTEPLFAAIFVSQGIFEPQPIARVMWLPVYAFVIMVLLRDWRQVLAMAPRTLLLGLLALLCWASFAWSVAPGDTLRRAFGLTMAMGLGLYLAWRFDWRQLLTLFTGVWIAMIIGCYIFALFFSPWHVMRDEHPGAWSGLWTHKNSLASITVFGVGAMMSAAVIKPRIRALALVGVAAGIGLILMSTGRTALLALAAGIGVLTLFWAMRRGPVAMVLLVAGGVGAAAFLAGIYLMAPQVLVELIGRDLTFTGRTDIWESIVRAVDARPWLGYGFGAFWIDEFGPRYWVQRDVGWKVIGAHNSWLEVMLAVGRVGLVLLLAQLSVMAFRAVRFGLDPVAGVFPPVLLAMTLVYTMSESYLLASNIFWLLYTAVAAKLAIAARPAPGLLASARSD
jgi:exopolysaccharide production protein ExoQ